MKHFFLLLLLLLCRALFFLCRAKPLILQPEKVTEREQHRGDSPQGVQVAIFRPFVLWLYQNDVSGAVSSSLQTQVCFSFSPWPSLCSGPHSCYAVSPFDHLKRHTLRAVLTLLHGCLLLGNLL